MNPVLIYTDTASIANEKARLNKVATLYQSILDAFTAINITVSIQEISNLASWTVSGNNKTDFVQDFATNKVIDAAGGLVVAGITLNRQKFIDLMDTLPNVTGVKAALNKASSVYNDGNAVAGARTNLLSLAGNVISKVADSDTQIETLYTYYTKTDASAQLATDFLALCISLNGFKAAHPNVTGWSFSQDGTVNIPGLLFLYGEFVLNLGYFRAFEALMAN